MNGKKTVKPEKSAGEALREKGLTLAVAESCTGGLLGNLITDEAGSSDYFIGGVIAYGNEVKKNLLRVKSPTLKAHGAVSKETAGEMAKGVRERLKTDIGVSITGIAGPGGGSVEKPVGTVFIAVSKGRRTAVQKFLFKGSRKSIKKKSAEAALKMLLEALS